MRLEKWRDGCRGREWADCFVTDGRSSAYAASEHFVFQIWPESDGDRSDAVNFWEQQGPGDYPDDDFVRGFARARRGKLDDDLISQLLAAESDGGRLSEDELLELKRLADDPGGNRTPHPTKRSRK